MRSWLAAALFALASPAAAQAPQPTVQQQFEAASTALEARSWSEAARLFEALETRLTSNARSLAVTRVRLATAYLGLGRVDDAAEKLRLGLPNLPVDDTTLYEDRFTGETTLGAIGEYRLSYSEAHRHYRAAIAIPVPEEEHLGAYGGLIQTEMFDDPQGALRDADAALALAAAHVPENRALEARLRTLRGRALINLDQFEEARTELREAVRLLGNLTLRVDHDDLVARSDLALAALRSGHEEDARRYLAYTGAGRFLRGMLMGTPSNEPPRCGEGGIRPEDVAVVEFAVLPDGRVDHVQPIYSSRPGSGALAFARAVAGWVMNLDSVGDVPPLLLSASRVELRCTNLPDEAIWDGEVELVRWLDDVVEDSYGRRRPLAALRAELAALEGGAHPDPVRHFRLLAALGTNRELPLSERADFLRRALALPGNGGASPDITALLLMRLNRAEGQAPGDDSSRQIDYAAVLRHPNAANDDAVAASIRMAHVYELYWHRHEDRALEAANALVQWSGLESNPRVRSEAYSLIAAVHASQGDPAAARADLASMGSAADPCFIPRRLEHVGGSSSDYPLPALHWGFEGWAMGEFAVGEGGVPLGEQVVIAYPAFVFGRAALHVLHDSRFAPGGLPGEDACPTQQTVNFRIP